MSKEEYATLHYLLAKLKYELIEEICTKDINKTIIQENSKFVEYIDKIEKIIRIDWKNENEI